MPKALYYDEAYNIWWQRISQFRRYVLDRQLGESDAALDLVTEFFPKGDISKKPLVTKFNAQLNILHSVGHLLKNLGHPREAESFYLREISGHKKLIQWENAGFSSNHLIGLYILIGSLSKGMKVFKDSLFIIRKIEEKSNNNYSKKSLKYSLEKLRLVLLAKKGWISFLLGKKSLALKEFQTAIKIQRKISNQQSHKSRSKKKGKRKHKHQNQQKINFLYGSSGIYYVMVLHRSGRYKEALELHLKNLNFCQKRGWQSEYSWCQWVLGDLLADNKENEKAQQCYSLAIKIAKNISNRPTLISALLARGCWMAKHLGDATAARSDLEEAFVYALSGGYRLFEIDIRVALASAYLVEGNIAKTQEQANKALEMSEKMKYYWGKIYAKEVLDSISST